MSTSLRIWHDYRLQVAVDPENDGLPPCIRLDASFNDVQVTNVTIFATLQSIEKIEQACAQVRMELAANEARALQRAERDECHRQTLREATAMRGAA